MVQLHQRCHVLGRGRAANSVQIDQVGRAIGGAEDHVAATDTNRALGISGVVIELARNRGNQLADQFPGNADAVAFDLGPASPQIAADASSRNSMPIVSRICIA